MSVEHVEVLVEEPSAEAALRILLPTMLGGTSFEIYPHNGKAELLQRLPNRLRGYARWLPARWRILVIVDGDDDDCVELKQRLEDIATTSGLQTLTVTGGTVPYTVVNRLAIEELEAWYFGDWEAVRAAYPRVPRTVQQRTAYRDPDAIRGGTWEALERILQRAGYFTAGLRKIEAARAIARHMVHERNRSRSFQVLRAVLLEMGPAQQSD